MSFIAENRSRTPPGQRLVKTLPVLHYGNVPRVDLEQWDFRLFGLVEEEVCWNYTEVRSLPGETLTSDIHCVTGWSMLDTIWEGVPTRELLRHVRLKPSARFVLIHAERGYTANLPLEVFSAEDSLLAWGYMGEELKPEHGWPLRLVVPSRYFWKSAKWVRGVEFLDRDTPGFWEQYGYHNEGDPWKEERYAGRNSRLVDRKGGS
jgi:DMSO/TMAO reductase YedYZ molybdopterin-dependent catalytic subunit